jgi:uncharacterized sulfatase
LPAAATSTTGSASASHSGAASADVAAETPETVNGLLTDPDAAVRFWGVQAVRVRGAAMLAASAPRLRALLTDLSPSVRIAAAQALADSPTHDDRTAALATLARLADPKESGYFASLAALEAIDSLGDRAKPLHATLASLSWKGSAPHARYQSYPARLVTSITGIAAPTEPAERN